jgi:trimeric autotransporter adhesin
MKITIPSRPKKLMSILFGLFLAYFPQYIYAQANDCTAATALTVFTGACGGATTGFTTGATQSMPACAGGTTADDDVWYSFVAAGGPHTITVTSQNPGRIQDIVFEVFDGTCGSLTSIVCQNATTGTATEAVTLGTLVSGTTYYVRIYSAANGSGQGRFTICITRPTPPANDNCATATLLDPDAVCTNGVSRTTGTLVGATFSGVAAGPCGGNADDDVWYSFIAENTTQTITLSGIGSAIAVNGSGIGGSAVLEVFSSSNNTCGGTLSSISCGFVSGANLVTYANGLTVGNTYFIRVYSTNSVFLSSNAGFTICIQNPFTGAPTLFFGKSFINITKGTVGGTVENGDELEIRASVVVRATSILDSCAFFDNIPAGTNYVPGSLAILTNEGKIYKAFSDAANDDEGTFNSGAITINMGYNPNDNHASAFRRGRMRDTHRPTVGGNACLMLASYRVTVTAATNSILALGGGSFTYALITNPSSVITQTFNNNNVIVYSDNGLCINSSGVNVLNSTIAGDFSGTFGSGNTMNRVASPNMPPGYTYTELTGNRPGDFFYGIANNTSNNAAGYSTVNTWPKPESPINRRIFGVFDVIGDHTGAADPFAGNPAADTTNGGTGGYMLLVNSSYNLDTVFKYPISGLCPNTYYELSFWMRNICSRCGSDSLARGASGVSVPVGYIPTDVNDSSGVYPNLSLSIDGINHYTTGNVKYTGQWAKKGFVFKTGVAQTNIEFAITNNAPGGGGNDWALDDISLATCTPNLNLTPSGNSQVCFGNQVDLSCDVISYFDNYVYYQWQVSHDNGVTWTDTLSMGTGSPTPSGGNYTYTATFPSFIADASQHLTQYRIRVATTPANLISGCSFFNSANIIVLVNNCQWVLKADLLSFTGQLNNQHAVLNWTASDVSERTAFDIQKSTDGRNFVTIGKVNGVTNLATYHFTDPDIINSAAYYRIMIKENGSQKISKTVLLTNKEVPFEIISVVNPFNDQLIFDVTTPNAVTANIAITDGYGKVVKLVKQSLQRGINRVQVTDLSGLAEGSYYLRVATPSAIQNKKLIKSSK